MDMQGDLIKMMIQKSNCGKLNLSGLKMSKAKFNNMGIDKPKYNGFIGDKVVDVSLDKKSIILTTRKPLSMHLSHRSHGKIHYKLASGSRKILTRMKTYLLTSDIPRHHTWNALRRASTLIRSVNKTQTHKSYIKKTNHATETYDFN